ncbi:MAG: hypothetical protein IT162_23550 [Bryobacterales bacterium]|nr:hypothetical protein [Bryobacterales bacterium]
METLLYLLLMVALFLIAGMGPVCWVWRRGEAAVNRLVWAPVAGSCIFLVICFRLTAFGLPGRQTVWAALGVVLLSAVLIPRERRFTREEWREAWPVFATGLGALLLANWPLLWEGYRNYLAFGNPDAPFNVAVWRNAVNLPFGDNPATGFSALYPPYSPGIQFGGAYFGILIAQLTGAELLALHQVVCGAFAFLAPLGGWLLARRIFDASPRHALLTAVLLAAASQVTFLVTNQSLGAIHLQVLLPAVLAAWDVALRPLRWPAVALASMLVIGTSFGYYAALPILAGLAGAAVLVAAVQRPAALPRLAALTAAGAAVAVLAYPEQVRRMAAVTLREAGSNRLQASLAGSDALLQFAFTLTELGLPYAWGIDYPQYNVRAYMTLAPGTDWGWLSPLFVLASYLASVAVSGIAIWGWWKAVSKEHRAFQLQVLLMVGAMVFYLLRNNGYGVFKFASWWCPIFIVCAVAGAARAGLPGSRRRKTAAAAVAILAVTNFASALTLGRISRSDDAESKSLLRSYRLSDFLELREAMQHVGPGERTLLAVTEVAVQDWAAIVLGQYNLVLASYRLGGGMGAEDGGAHFEPFERGHEQTKWIVASRDLPLPEGASPPVWRGRRLQLLRADRAGGGWTLGAGWYRAEPAAAAGPAWQRDFRWLRRRGDVLIYSATEPMRLYATFMAGPGNPKLDRRLRLRLDGQLIEEHQLHGASSFVSRPFQPTGIKSRLTIELDDAAKPLSRVWGLNSWVPIDPRRLNVAVIGLRVEPAALEPAIDPRLVFPPRATRGLPPFDGMFMDGWVAGQAQFDMRACGAAPVVRVRGEAPAFPGRRFPLPVELQIDGDPAQTLQIAEGGEFQLERPASAVKGAVAGECRPIRIALRPLFEGYRSAGSDQRGLTVRITEIAVQPAK